VLSVAIFLYDVFTIIDYIHSSLMLSPLLCLWSLLLVRVGVLGLGGGLALSMPRANEVLMGDTGDRISSCERRDDGSVNAG
jgi:hypothetical protein